MNNNLTDDIKIAEKNLLKGLDDIPELQDFSAWSKFLLTTALLFPILARAVDPAKVRNVIDLKREIISGINSSNKNKRDFHIFMHGIIMRESEYNPNAKSKPDSKGRRAWGIFQFRQRTIDDINRVYKTKYTVQDALDPSKAVDMFNKYFIMLQKYYKHYFNGKNPTYQDIAMMYKEGLKAPDPDNEYHEKAQKYWKSVKNHMDRIK